MDELMDGWRERWREEGWEGGMETNWCQAHTFYEQCDAGLLRDKIGWQVRLTGWVG